MDRHRHTPAITPDLNLNSLTDLMFVEYSEQLVSISDFLVVNANDDITQFNVAHFRLLDTPQTRCRCATASCDLVNQNPVVDRQVDLVSKRRNITCVDTQLRTRHPAVLQQL